MKLNKLEYLLIGSNNFWYGIESNLKNAKERRKNIIENKGTGYDDPETRQQPERIEDIYIYQSREVLN